MQRINFQDTEVIKAPYVNINGTEYPVQSQFEGGTDLNAETFNQMQDNIEEAIGEVQPTIEEWKDFPTGAFTYVNFLEEYRSLIFSCDIPTLNDVLKESFMIVKFKYNDVTKYGCVVSAGQYGLYLYVGTETGFDTGTYTDFQYTTNKYLEEIPQELTWNFIQFLTEASILDNNIIGFYSNHPVYEPFTKYSSSEQMIGVWIDGRPVYRKVVNYGNLPNNAEVGVNHGISNLGLVIDVKAIAYRSGDSNFWPLPFVGLPGTSSGDISLRVDSSQVKIGTRTDRTSVTAYVVIEYVRNQSRNNELPLWPQIPSQEDQRGIESGETEEEGNR